MALSLSCCFSMSSLHPIYMRHCPNSKLMPQNHEQVRDLLITEASVDQSIGSKSDEERLLLLQRSYKTAIPRSNTAFHRSNTTFHRSVRTYCSLPSNPAIPQSNNTAFRRSARTYCSLPSNPAIPRSKNTAFGQSPRTYSLPSNPVIPRSNTARRDGSKTAFPPSESETAWRDGSNTAFRSDDGDFSESFRSDDGNFSESFRSDDGKFSKSFRSDDGKFSESFRSDDGKFSESFGSDDANFSESFPSDDGNLSESTIAAAEDVEMEHQSMADFYSWEDQWYPLYLTREVPRDAPLALQVFHRQLVLHYDGHGVLHCYEDRCPHRLAKLSEGQIIDGKLECLYHGWQFEGDGQCVKIPQLPKGAKIPNAACVRSFPVCDHQEVVWVWMGTDRNQADTTRIPHFDQFDDPHNQHFSSMHALPYDHSILLENLMDPAHVPISHDRTDITAKRENAQALKFEITERTPMGFSGTWAESSSDGSPSFTRFQAPCVLSTEKRTIDKDGCEARIGVVFLCRPSGLGKSMLIVRFGFLASDPKRRDNTFRIPEWILHQVSNKVFEQDMGFLASQNEVLMREKVPTSLLYLNLRSSDVFVMEYRKWLDKVGHGMPYYFGHKTLLLPSTDPIVDAAPAGLVAAIASSQPTKGVTTLALGLPFSLDPTNRYFRHVVHCAMCRKALKNFVFGQKLLITLTLLCGALGMALYTRSPLRFGLILSSVLCALGSYACQFGINMLTTNTVRPHRQ